MQNEVNRLEGQIAAVRYELRGLTFDEAAETFKNLESLKVRLAVASNPNHYAEKYMALDEQRKLRMAKYRRVN